jgi:hypothetical protein
VVYREFKLREDRTAPSFIHATITRLGTILGAADERELITRNPVPARGEPLGGELVEGGVGGRRTGRRRATYRAARR